MLNSQKRIFIVLVLLLLFITCNFFIININNLYLISSMLLIFSIIITFFIGYEKDKYPYKKSSNLSMILYMLLYQVIIYLFGIVIGFLKSPYNLSIFGIIRNILPLILFILTSEFLRYLIIKKNTKKSLFLLCVIVFTLLDLVNTNIFFDTMSKEQSLLFLTTIFPCFFKSLLCTYSTNNFGYQPSIIFRIILILPMYIIPLIPNLNNYVESVLVIILSVIILIKFTNRSKKVNNVSVNNKKYYNIIYAIIITWLLVVVYLTCGYFDYYALSIGSESMKEELDKGDVVIVDKTFQNELNNINIGDILVHTHNNVIVVHRVLKTDDKRSYFITKGDNNKEADNWVIYPDEVIGVATFKIKYIGIPTVYLNEMYN